MQVKHLQARKEIRLVFKSNQQSLSTHLRPVVSKTGPQVSLNSLLYTFRVRYLFIMR